MQENDLNEQAMRKTYNQQYYLRNKQRILERKRKKPMSSFDRPYLTLVRGKTVILPYFRTIAWGNVLLLLMLNLGMTYLLIREAAPFYLDPLDSPLSGYFKASLIEVIAILFSFPRGRSLLFRWSERLLVIGCCLLSLWTISSRVVGQSLQDVTRQQFAQKNIAALEKSGTEISDFLQVLKNKGWITAARKYEKELAANQRELVSARDTLITMKTPKLEIAGLAMLLVFRFLIFFSNLICAHFLVERIRVLSKIRRSQYVGT